MLITCQIATEHTAYTCNAVYITINLYICRNSFSIYNRNKLKEIRKSYSYKLMYQGAVNT